MTTSPSKELLNLLKNKDVTVAEKLKQATHLLNEKHANADHYEIVTAIMTDRYESPTGWLVQNYLGSHEEDTILQLLLQNGANPTGLGMTLELGEEIGFQDLSAMHYCCYVGNAHLVRLIIQTKSDVTFALTERRELNPLMLAAMQGHKEVVQLLLEQGEKIRRADAHGNTAVHFAEEYPEITA
eukprot:CAMPEP_0119021946 /NCGR_PEP_ID=MMETSP1176-20130426/27037_1 /TAXON_ID=265551 /ORGANISM="Synedropsis recta cf, Strain CCMP1620" /LENGTH=183 /DNA_ID=CAMNT_0006976667 /DNA_START=26 /DNA_END=573 /DNA_ORIENTATION=+